MNRRVIGRMPAVCALAAMLLSGCGSNGQQAADAAQASPQQTQTGGAKADYPTIKAMVLDILHSKEGMSTLQDTMSSPEFKRLTAVTQADVAAAVEKTISQGQNKSFLAQQMKDPQFAAALVTAAKTQMMEIQRQLMKDPAYMQDLLTLLQSPEFQKTQFTLLQSPQYRAEIMKIMTEALQQPTFRLLFMDSMKQAVQEAGGGQASKIGQQQGQQGQQGKSKQGDQQGKPEANKETEKGAGGDSDSGGEEQGGEEQSGEGQGGEGQGGGEKSGS